MIQLTSAANLTNAINKARAVKPHVHINRFGSYTVTNKTAGATYTVECIKRDGKPESKELHLPLHSKCRERIGWIQKGRARVPSGVTPMRVWKGACAGRP